MHLVVLTPAHTRVVGCTNIGHAEYRFGEISLFGRCKVAATFLKGSFSGPILPFPRAFARRIASRKIYGPCFPISLHRHPPSIHMHECHVHTIHLMCRLAAFPSFCGGTPSAWLLLFSPTRPTRPGTVSHVLVPRLSSSRIVFPITRRNLTRVWFLSTYGFEPEGVPFRKGIDRAT